MSERQQQLLVGVVIAVLIAMCVFGSINIDREYRADRSPDIPYMDNTDIPSYGPGI